MKMLCLAKAQHCQGEEEKELKRDPTTMMSLRRSAAVFPKKNRDLPLNFLQFWFRCFGTHRKNISTEKKTDEARPSEGKEE